MRVLFLASQAWPYGTGNGNAVLNYGLIRSLLKLKYTVTFVPVGIRQAEVASSRSKQALSELGVTIREFGELKNPHLQSKAKKLKRLLALTDDDVLPTPRRVLTRLQGTLDQEDNAIVFASGWHTFGIANALRARYSIASIVDLLEIHIRVRSGQLARLGPKHRLLARLGVRQMKRLEKLVMQQLHHFDLVLEHAAHHAQELSSRGYRSVHYIPHPMVVERRTLEERLCSEVTVLMPGSLKGVSSHQGFEFLLQELVPALEALAGEENAFRFRVVGHGKMDPGLESRLKRVKNLDFVGFVDDIGAEYAAADIVLVTVPVPQGFRTRIAEVFGHGKCVVAHSANAVGMPEIRHRENALLADNGSDMAKNLLDAINSRALREELGHGAMTTYERSYSMHTAVTRLKQLIPREHQPG